MNVRATAPAIEQTAARSTGWQGAIWARIGPVSGIVFVILTFVGLTIADPNTSEVDANPDQASSVIARVFMEQRTDMEFGLRFHLASLVFLILFIAYVHRRIERVEAGRGWAATATLLGGAGLLAVMLMMSSFALAITSIEDYGGDTAVARTLAALSWHAVELLSAPLAVFAGGISVAAWRYRALPRWVAYIGAPISLVMLVASVSFLGSGFWFGFLAFWLCWLWLLAISIYTSIRPDAQEPAVPAG
ncbi:hypothetical protein BH23CHL2_BH23CHL2_07580 [soil metagenome]